jgi:PAS domain S-box-containing protein
MLRTLKKSKSVRRMVPAVLVIVLAFPLIDKFLIYPRFKGLIVEEVKRDSVQVASHIAAMTGMTKREFSGDLLKGELKRNLEIMEGNFKLEKLKVFSPSGEVIYSTNPKDVGTVNDKPYFRKIVAGGGTYTKVVRKDDESMEGHNVSTDVAETYVPIMKEGSFVGALEIYYDITGRLRDLDKLLSRFSAMIFLVALGLIVVLLITSVKVARAEDELRKLSRAVEQSPITVVVTDAEGRVEYVNPKFTQLTGYNPDEVLGRPMGALNLADQPQGVYKKLFEAAGNGREWKEEFRSLKKNEEPYWELASISPIRDSKGTTTHYLVVQEDITERKCSEGALRSAHEDLKRAYESLEKAQSSAITSEKLAALGRLTAGVSHEILNPLNIITLRLFMMINKPNLPDDVMAELKTLEEQANRIVKIAKDLLFFSRQRKPERRVLNLSETVKRTVEFVGHDLRLQNVDVKMELADELPSLLADQDQLQQVVLNLVSNARDVMPEGGRLTLRTDAVSSNRNHYVELRVEDTGKGIPSGDINKLFDPFFTTKPEGEGTGLGLSICQGIVEAHGGTIWAENLSGNGAAFVVRLGLEGT